MNQSAKKNIIFSCADGAAYSMMVGCGETYIAAFALAIGMSQITAGLTGTLPLLAGGTLQLIGPTGARWFRSYRRWVLFCATLQGGAFLPLTYAAMKGTMSAVALFATCAMYWGFGMAAGPAWNNWIDRSFRYPRPPGCLPPQYYGALVAGAGAGLQIGPTQARLKRR